MAKYCFSILLLLVVLMSSKQGYSQQTAKTTGSYGYLEKLPPDYLTAPTKKYPVLFFLHGLGETGNGSPAELNRIKVNGPPYFIENGHQMCFTNPSTGVNECFIVISPQLPTGFGGWWAGVLSNIFNYVMTGPQNYRIDVNRVYVTGLSLGGQGVYNSFDPSIPDIFAAGAPVCAFSNGNACTISARKVSMWGFHGTSDGTITYATGYGAFDAIRTCTTPVPVAEYKWTSYPGLGHNIWNNYAYRVDNNLHTPNLYEWLLTKSKASPPTANAGLDINLTLPTSSTIIVGSGSDPGGSITGYKWTQISGAAATLTNDLTSSLTVSGLTAGTYVFRLTVTDNDTFTGYDDVTVTVSSIPSLLITNPTPVCSPGTADITLAAITAGSTAGLTYTYWTDAAATNSLATPTSVSAGTYYIKGTIPAGGSDTKPVVVTTYASPNLVITNPAPICASATANLTSASITTGSTVGLTYTYWTNSTATTTLPNPSTVGGGTYYIKGTNLSGCPNIKPVVVNLNPTPAIVITNPVSVCSPSTVDLTNASVTSGSSVGLTFTYWTNAGATTSLSTPTTAANGTFYIKGTNASSCFDIKPVVATVNPGPNVLITNPTAVCAPATIDLTQSSLTTGSTARLTYSYWSDAGASIALASPSSISSTNTYYIKGTNASFCSSIKPVTVTINPAASVVVTNPVAVCTPATINITAASVTSGSTAGLTYTYWTDAGATNPLASPAALSTSGTFFIKGANAGCSDIKPVTVTVNPSPNLIITNPTAVCAPSTIDLTLASVTAGSSGGLTLSYWSDAAASVALATPSAITSSSTYYIKATNAGLCPSIKPVVVTINPVASVTVTDPAPVCTPGTVNITALSVTAGSTAGLTYTYWTDAGATTPLASPAALSTGGTFFIKGANAGCSDIKPVTVTVNPSPNLIITNPTAVCAPATIDITSASVTAGSSGGLTLSYWTDAAASVALATPSAITSSATYYIKATNAGVCPSIKPVVVTINPVASVTVIDPAPVCTPATVNITALSVTAGSTAGLTYTYWTDAGATTPLASPAALSTSGTFFIKGANAGCSDVKPVTVTVNPSPNLIITNPTAVCAPLTVDLTLASVTAGSSGGLTLSYWSDAAATVALATPSSITSSATYYIKATNAGVCPSIKPVVVTINPVASVTVTDPAPACTPATVNITALSVTAGSTAGLTFTYWTDAGATNPLASPAALSTGGTFFIKGANAGCSDIKPVTVTFNAPPNVTITNPSAVCEPATIDLTAASITAGSTARLTFSYWTNSSGTTSLSSPNSVAAGTYFIKGTNTTTGCSDIKSVVVTTNPMPLVVATPNSSTICTASTTNIALSTSNTVPGGVSYAWTSSLLSGNASGFSDSNGSTISQNLTTTTGGVVRYTIVPTSVTGGCAGSSTSVDVTVSLIPDVAVNTGASTSVVCSGCSTTIVLQNPNNVAGTTFSWTASVLNGTVSGQSSGSGSTISQILTKTSATGAVRYTITPKAGSCNGIPTTFDVRINAIPTVNAGSDQSISLPTNSIVLNGSGTDDGTIVSYTWTKLTGPSTFTLQNASTPTLTVTDLIVGIYVFRLEVKDDDSAIGFDDVTVNVSPKVNLPPAVSAGPDIDLQLPTNQVMITGTATDPDGTIKSTAWSQVSGPSATLNVVANTIELTNLIEGTYVFRFSATDNGDVTASDDVSVAVAPNNFSFTAERKKFITPNGDGQNDFWVLDTNIAKFASCKLIILQNDGSKVLETTGYQNNWDGTANGKVLPQDVYYYVLECNGVKDSGSITIIR